MNGNRVLRSWRSLLPLSVLVLVPLVLLVGCGDDDNPVSPAPETKYEIVFALWLWDPPEISVVAGVRRLDPNAAPANACVVRVNGDTLEPNWMSDADEAGYELALPAFSPGASYSFVATVGASSAQSTLLAPQSLATLQIVQPADSVAFVPGDSLPIAWEYDGPSFGETDVGLVAGCADSTFEHRVLLDGNARSYTISSAVTAQVETCVDGTYIEVIALTSGVVEGGLASPESKWYIVHASDIRQLVDPVHSSMAVTLHGKPWMPGDARNSCGIRARGRACNLTKP